MNFLATVLEKSLLVSGNIHSVPKWSKKSVKSLSLKLLCWCARKKKKLILTYWGWSSCSPLRGHLHMVLIKLMLHQRRPDEWLDLWLFCPLANVSVLCLARTPCGGRNVADAEDRKNSSAFSVWKARLWSAARFIADVEFCSSGTDLLQMSSVKQLQHCRHSHAYFSEKWQWIAATAVEKTIFHPRQFSVAAANCAAPAGFTVRI